MQPYRDLTGTSGVKAFELSPRSIVVEFQDGARYEYTEEITGIAKVRAMRQLALAGQGLSTYISQQVRERYAHKIR